MIPSGRYVHNLIKYEFDWQFEIPATYPTTAPEIELPELDGKGDHSFAPVYLQIMCVLCGRVIGRLFAEQHL